MGVGVILLSLEEDEENIERITSSNYYAESLDFRLKHDRIILEFDKTKANKNLFDLYKNKIVKSKTLTIDYDNLLDMKSFENDDAWELDDVTINSDGSTYCIFINKKLNLRFEVDEDDIPYIEHEYDSLVFTIEEEFKNQLNDDFFEVTKLNDYDENCNRDENAITVIVDNEKLTEIKKLFKENAPIQDWRINENQVVKFSW